jgi:hypothetical protein
MCTGKWQQKIEYGIMLCRRYLKVWDSGNYMPAGLLACWQRSTDFSIKYFYTVAGTLRCQGRQLSSQHHDSWFHQFNLETKWHSTEWHHIILIQKMKPKRCPQSVRSWELPFGMLRMHFGQVFAVRENIHVANYLQGLQKLHHALHNKMSFWNMTDDPILIMCAWREFRRTPGNFFPICPTVWT